MYDGDGKRGWRSDVPDLLALQLSLGEEVGNISSVGWALELAQVEVGRDEFGDNTTKFKSAM